jgi:hypothetical protein
MFVDSKNQLEKATEVKSVFPKRRQDLFADNSWGYKNSYFAYDEKKKALCLSGSHKK